MADIRCEKLLDALLEQLRRYGSIHRKSTQPFIRDRIAAYFPTYLPDFEDTIIRESLLEHVGSLPVIATFLHPYMDRSVDLGKSLTMLAIHDIGELAVGDKLVFLKTAEQGEKEIEAAIAALHTRYHDLYREIDELATNEARFVKSIDKLAPDLLDLLSGEEYSIRRMVAQAGWKSDEVIRNIRRKKRPFMEWSPFLLTFHDEIFTRFRSESNLVD